MWSGVVQLDPASAATYALVAICLVLVGAILTVGYLGVAERAAVLVTVGTVLLVIARFRRSAQ